MNAVTNTDLVAAFKTVLAVAEAIREAGSIPSGQLYAALLGRIDLAGYTKIIDILKRQGLISEDNHLLRWVGPKTLPS